MTGWVRAASSDAAGDASFGEPRLRSVWGADPRAVEGLEMRIHFESNHPARDFSGGALVVRVLREDAARGLTTEVAITFEVPRDFHTHNDSVAAALLAIVGPHYSRVSFNFPISTHCADILREHYALDEIGPVDTSHEPRLPGSKLGLLLSGGLDSMAIWLVLRRVLSNDFKVITTEFGGGFAFEALGFRRFRRDVTCRTNFRERHVHRGPRFHYAVPLLFADYADLGAVTTGHHYGEDPLGIQSLRDGRRPAYLANDGALRAGGLEEVHIARTLQAVGPMLLNLTADPDLLEACFHGSAPAGSLKHYSKGMILRSLLARGNRPIPPWLQTIAPPAHKEAFVGGTGVRYQALYLAKHLGIDAARPMVGDIDRYDLSILDDVALRFLERYNTNLTQYVPDELRAGTLAAFHAAGILPYDERDFDELNRLREYQRAASAGRALREPVPDIASV